MFDQNEQMARSFALELLTDVNAWPHIDKEALFATGIAFYRWFFRETSKEEDMAVYAHEFAAHHNVLMHDLDAALQEAAFVTWFVECGFHKLPLFGWSDLRGETTRFSLPSFRLPTDTPENTFLVQWLIWHLNLPRGKATNKTPYSTLRCWSRDLVSTLPDPCELDRELLVFACDSFFCWCQTYIHTWDAIHHYMRKFVRARPELVAEQTSVWDAHFINWFVEHILAGRPVDEWSDENAS